ncbi:DUF3318 domain-containing protein [Calothrix sp. NIES-3974]|uniref:DUF3318 domain-containing protein n=1 Tax=Calothrix sp. NIES-3974 TaxID=2005462 RepID=UPI000B612C5E|nr:DUF3318 domain-containing protein [Calothrix sp. NIES-3974]BAZ03905.1 hypothetical protein NIES3974_05350 [Calothrix sp. NIES-3974]
MEPKVEINRLLELIPTSARILTPIISKPEQKSVIAAEFPLPWSFTRPIYINFDLWQKLSRSQRDLLLLRTVGWLLNIKWFQPSINHVLFIAGCGTTIVEITQVEPIGITVACGLLTVSIFRIWRNHNSQQNAINADETAIKIAQQKGYTATSAAEALLSTIKTIAQIEGRTELTVEELIRIQNLQLIAGFASI